MEKDYIIAAVKPLSEESTETRRKLASNPTSSERILRMLAEDEDITVRTLVALNSNAPEDLVNYLKDGRMLPEYGINVCSCYDWEWDPRDYMDDYCDNAVIFGEKYDFTDAEWWSETIAFLSNIWDQLSEATSYEEFLQLVEEDYEDDYESEDLKSLYQLYENYGYSSGDYFDEDFTADAVEIVYPGMHIDQTRIYATGQYVGRERESAYVIYDRDEVDIDRLADWYFGDVYETREYRLDIDNIPTDSNVSAEEAYYDYGEDIGYYNMLSNTDLEEMKESGDIEKAIAEYCGYYKPGECYVFGDI